MRDGGRASGFSAESGLPTPRCQTPLLNQLDLRLPHADLRLPRCRAELLLKERALGRRQRAHHHPHHHPASPARTLPSMNLASLDSDSGGRLILLMNRRLSTTALKLLSVRRSRKR